MANGGWSEVNVLRRSLRLWDLPMIFGDHSAQKSAYSSSLAYFS